MCRAIAVFLPGYGGQSGECDMVEFHQRQRMESDCKDIEDNLYGLSGGI